MQVFTKFAKKHHANLPEMTPKVPFGANNNKHIKIAIRQKFHHNYTKE
jgi:hypothetical protein